MLESNVNRKIRMTLHFPLTSNGLILSNLRKTNETVFNVTDSIFTHLSEIKIRLNHEQNQH